MLTDLLAALGKRLRAMVRPGAAEGELSDEIRFHLDMEARKLRATGMTPAQANRAARLAFGGVENFKEEVRAGRGLPWLGEAARDLRQALNAIRRTPAFAAVAVTTLALGIGAATAIFALVDGVILRRLPYPEPDQLVHVQEINPEGSDFVTSGPSYLDFQAGTSSLEAMGAYRPEQFGLTGRGEPQLITGASATASLFTTLGVGAAFGRTFSPEEDQPGAPARVVVLSHALWQGAFGGDSTVVGQTAVLRGEPHTVIGVLPPTFRLLGAEAWIPLGPAAGDDRGDRWLSVVGRMKPGLDVAQVTADLGRIATANAAVHPSLAGWGVRVIPLTEWAVGADLRRTGTLLSAAVAILLLLACANVANLLLARATARETELAIRIALGAGRGRLIRQLLVESGTLALLGAVAGLVGVRWIVLATRGIPDGTIPGLEALAISPRVLVFSLGATILTTLVAGLAPALRGSGVDLHSTLKRAGRSGTSSGAHRLRELLVVAQVALAMLLLVGGGLMIRSVVRLSRANIGLATEHVWTVPLSLPASRYAEEWQSKRFYAAVADRITALPGIVAVGATVVDPFSGFNLVNDVTPEERAALHPSAGYLQAGWRIVTPGYFEASGVPILQGRDFNAGDSEDGIPVALISRGLADRLWPGEVPIGRRLFWGGTDGTPRTVIGVVGDISDVAVERDPTPMMFLSTRQFAWGSMTLIVRGERDIAEISEQVRRAVWAEDAELPVPTVRPLTDSRDRAIATPRLGAIVIGLFAAAAVTLALVGLYGVLSYTVVERTREIGIRIALGARPALVVGQLVGRGLRLAVIGIVVGLGGAIIVAPLMRELLYQTTPTDPMVLVAVPLLLALVAALAAFVPARRAARVDPATAIRSE
jgi:predicted permease